MLSDSHAYALKDLPGKAVDELSGMDLIVHAGDYTGKGLLDELRKLGDFKGVYGNMDPPEVRGELPGSDVLELMGFKIGVTHPPEGVAPFRLMKRVRAKFERVDVIVYGHSHWSRNEVIDGIPYFNPGSITGVFPARHKTFGILRIEKEVNGEIIKV
ncbi:MAG: Phosphodiesterase [Candidatus Bathyarchaeota archaeon BA1]|nr:MAG: Phosphodiesterase [Candidatus Bathyarchaeota archaeon BA1]